MKTRVVEFVFEKVINMFRSVDCTTCSTLCTGLLCWYFIANCPKAAFGFESLVILSVGCCYLLLYKNR